MLSNWGVAPTAAQSAWELHLSHWTGSTPSLQIVDTFDSACKVN
jgi:hypothetical protein